MASCVEKGAGRESLVDVARCVANYLIVILHAGGAACQYGVGGSAEYLAGMFLTDVLANVALPALFLVSGYLLFRGYSVAAWPRRMWRRVRRFMPPYLLWNSAFVLFYLACAQFAPRLRARVEAFGIDTFRGALAKIADLTVQPIDVPFWYVRTLLLFAVVSPCLWVALRGRLGRWLGGGAVLSYYVLCLQPDGACFVVPGHPPFALVAFYAGGLVAVSGQSLAEAFRGWLWPVTGVAAVTVHTAAFAGYGMDLDWSVCGLLKVPLFFWLLGHLPLARIVSSRVFACAQDNAFFVFAGHFLFCSLWVHGLGPRLPDLPFGSFFLPALLFCVPGLATTVLVHRLARRISFRLTCFWDGNLR